MRLETFFPYRLAVVAEAFSRQLVAVYGREHGFSREEWRLLFLLEEAGTLDSLQLSQRTSLDKVQVSRAATRLEEAGLLRKSEHRTDRRLIVLELTPSGQALMRRLGRIARDFQARLAQELGDDGPALERALSRLIAAEPESPARN